MSETITEMVLPGTYIEVRAEGLIGIGGISTGNIGIVGTANRGPIGEVKLLGSYTEVLDTFGSYDAWTTTDALTLTRALEQVFRGGGSTIYAVRIAKGSVATKSWDFQDSTTASLFKLEATSPGTWANDIAVTFTAATMTDPAKIQLVYGREKEVFTGANAGQLVAAAAISRLIKVTGYSSSSATVAVATMVEGSDVSGNGADATATEVDGGLAKLATQPVNLVTVAGMPVTTAGGSLLSHLEATENDGMERVGILGTSSDDAATAAGEMASVSNPRLVVVTPGIKADDAAKTSGDKQVSLSPAYAAALITGRLATLAPHVSLTNKDVAVAGLSKEYTRAEQKNLLNNRLLVLVKNLGFRALKGISSDTGAFRQISVRRIVDYAKAGVRIGCNPYIGRLNNARVRAAMKATLDGFLSSMVLDEMLTGYELDVSATRAQEIAGQAIVTMTLQPTFSIDYIKVIMNLE